MGRVVVSHLVVETSHFGERSVPVGGSAMRAFPALTLRWKDLPLTWFSSLYLNSFYLVAASVANAAFGLFFWTAAARFFRPQDVGLAAAAVSAVGLLAMLSTLGLDYALLGFLPQATNPERIINSSLTIGGATALFLSLVFVGGLGVWSPALLPLRANPTFVVGLILAAILTTVSGLLAATFLARKKASLVFSQSMIFGTVKFATVLLFAVSVFGAVGLIGAWTVGLVAAVTCGICLFLPYLEAGHGRFRPAVAREVINDMAHFAFANYASTMLWSAPTYLLPLLIANKAGPEVNAYFYIASSVGGLLVMIPTAVSLSLFAHGAHDGIHLARRTVESAKITLLLLIPAIAGVFLFGGKVLLIFGQAYSTQGTRLLWTLALSTVPLTVNFLFFSVRRVQQRMAGVIVSTGWILLTTLGLSVLLLPRIGLVGAGVAWFIAQTSVAVVILVRYLLNR